MYNHYAKKGIIFINDLIDEYGHFLKLTQFGEIYKVNRNFINCISLINAVKSFISTFSDLKDEHLYKINNPIFPFKLRLLLKS